MQEIENYFDDRLFTHGIDNVAWDGAGQPDQQHRTVTLRFPVANAQPIEIAERVIRNAEETEYQAITINDALQERGIRDIRVEAHRNQPVHSDIYITIEGEPEPLRVTKRY